MPKPPKPTAPPSWIEPCIPTLVEKPSTGPNWRHEIKWDGYRISIVIDAGAVKVRTRKGLDWTAKFLAIAASAAKRKCRNAIIDGEAVILDGKGRPDFGALQTSLAEGRSDAVAYVCDLFFSPSTAAIFAPTNSASVAARVRARVGGARRAQSPIVEPLGRDRRRLRRERLALSCSGGQRWLPAGGVRQFEKKGGQGVVPRVDPFRRPRSS